MKIGLLLSLSIVLITACGREDSTTYQVPKKPAAPAQIPSMGSSADNEAVMAAHTAMAARTPAGSGFFSELPDGWTEKPGSGMRKVSYSIEGTSIDFYLISLGMGDLISNVNRWRGQVGLELASVEEIEEATETLVIDGHATRYTEINNDEGGRGIIAAIIDLAPNYWYFTAKGTPEELKANASDIRAFLESIKMNP